MRVVLKRIGIILVRTFTSSTCVIVHTFHLLIGFVVPSGAIAALSRILHGPIRFISNDKYEKNEFESQICAGKWERENDEWIKYITLVFGLCF